jgi:hypothetical protein
MNKLTNIGGTHYADCADRGSLVFKKCLAFSLVAGDIAAYSLDNQNRFEQCLIGFGVFYSQTFDSIGCSFHSEIIRKYEPIFQWVLLSDFFLQSFQNM